MGPDSDTRTAEAPEARASACPTVVVMGVSASGKTRVGAAIAHRLGASFVDGDDLHPPANVDKMASGIPLTDEDRWPWLDRVGAVLRDRDVHPGGVVLACSALRRTYRDRIRQAVGDGLVFVFLDVTPAEARRRIDGREGHYMPPSLLDSQFQTLERPEGEADVLTFSRLDGVEPVAERAVRAIRDRHTGNEASGAPKGLHSPSIEGIS